MLATTFISLAAMAATSMATTLYVNYGCIEIGQDHTLCHDDGGYSINGDSAMITCKLDADPTFVSLSWPSHYAEIYWTAGDCLEDAGGNVIDDQCASTIGV